MQAMDALLATEFLGNSVLRWAIALAAGLGTLIALSVAKSWVSRRIKSFSARTTHMWDDVLSDAVSAVRGILVWIVAAYVTILLLDVAPSVSSTATTVLTIALIAQLALSGNRALQAVGQHYRDNADIDGGRRTTLAAFTFLGRLALASIAILLILENLGVDITALLAGIGIGAVAIGLALQNILSDLFASLSIVLDKPFEIGDYVVVDDLSGTIENIGLRTTRVRSLSGEQLVFANNDLLTSRIRNYKRMTERRIAFTIGVTYDTPPDALREIPDVIRGIVESQEPVRFDRAHFKAFNDSSLDFEVVYWMLDPDYGRFMDVQQAINLALVDTFNDKGIEFAFPTRTVIVQGDTEARLTTP